MFQIATQTRKNFEIRRAKRKHLYFLAGQKLCELQTSLPKNIAEFFAFFRAIAWGFVELFQYHATLAGSVRRSESANLVHDRSERLGIGDRDIGENLAIQSDLRFLE